MTQSPGRLTFVRATPADAKRMAAHEQRVADRLYGPPLDRHACAREIAANALYFALLDGALAATAAWKRREDGSAYLSNIAVDPDNAAAIALYGSLGFAVDARRENPFGDGGRAS